VTILALVYAAKNSYSPSNARHDNVSGNPPFLAFDGKCNHSKILVGNSSQTNGGSYNIGINPMGANPHGIIIDTYVDPKILPMSEHQIHDAKTMSKPRMALFQGREDDELMAQQNNSAGNSLDESKNSIISSDNSLKDLYIIKLGAFYFDAKQNVMKDGNIDFIATMSTSIIFRGANLSKENELCQFKKPPDIRSKLTIGTTFIDVSC
jgi:hypothetical protein